MEPIILGWQNVLTDHVNQIYGRDYEVADLDFKTNPFHKPMKGRKVIDVYPANDKNMHRGLLNIEPYDPNLFFHGIPLIVYADDDSTGSEIIDILSSSYGIIFDKELDFDKAFLERTYQIDLVPRDVTIQFAVTSMIWEGTINVTTVSRGYNLAKEVLNRDLDVLIIPDISEPNTQSLRLITAPLIITNPTLVRAFSASTPVVLENDTLTKLMEEITSQRIVDASDAGELEDLFRGRTITSHETGDEGYDRYMETVDTLESGKWSGKPRFRFKSVVIDNDVQEIVGDIIITDLDQAGIKLSSFFTGAGYWEAYLPNLLQSQMDLYPERADQIRALLETGVENVFTTMTRGITGDALTAGKATVYLETNPASMYIGQLAITFPLPNFAVESESGATLDMETSGIIEMEKKYIIVITNNGVLSDGDVGTPVSSATVEEGSLMALMLFEPDVTNMVKLKSDVVETPITDGHSYTQPDWPGVEVHAITSGS